MQTPDLLPILDDRLAKIRFACRAPLVGQPIAVTIYRIFMTVQHAFPIAVRDLVNPANAGETCIARLTAADCGQNNMTGFL